MEENYLRLHSDNPYKTGIIIKYDNRYIKYIISYGHSDKTIKNIYVTDEEEFNKYGKKYGYDCDTHVVYEIVNNYDPKLDNISYLLSRLKIECNLKIVIEQKLTGIFHWFKNMIIKWETHM